MKHDLKPGDKIAVHTKSGRQHIGIYCYLPNGYIGLDDLKLAIPRSNIEKIMLIERKK